MNIPMSDRRPEPTVAGIPAAARDPRPGLSGLPADELRSWLESRGEAAYRHRHPRDGRVLPPSRDFH